MTNKQRLVFHVIKVFGELSPHQIAKKMGYTESSPIAQQLIALYKIGLLEKNGKGKNTKYKINEKYIQ